MTNTMGVTLTRLKMTLFLLVVLLLQLWVGPSPPGHSARTTVTSHSYRLTCKRIISSTRSTDWIETAHNVKKTKKQSFTFEFWSISNPHRNKETVHVHMKNARLYTCRC